MMLQLHLLQQMYEQTVKKNLPGGKVRLQMTQNVSSDVEFVFIVAARKTRVGQK